MKKLLVAAALFSLFCLPALAADAPAFEIFGGYSLIHTMDNDKLDLSSQTAQGFIAAVEGNVHPNFGIVGEFGFYQNTESGVESYNGFEGIPSALPYEYGWEEKTRHYPILFGPRVSYRGDTVRVFAHYLLGFAKTTWDWKYWEEYEGYYEETGSEGDTNFAQAVGGGIDISLNDTFSIRPAQVDWVSIRVSGDGDSTWINGIRYSGGIVIKLGSR
ncbi:MAG: outer membrane beta-barrel protein [Acidobacteria bacterium]|nr:outer membrane beta-barrel protein [Acidobacteriota bacterium]